MSAPDREKVINELTECVEHIRFNDFPKIPFWGDCQMIMMKALQLLKELPVWHTFRERELDEEEKREHPDWNYIIDVDCVPGSEEEFLWFRKCSGSISIASWDDEMWMEHGCTGDGDPIEDGDAWMELPHPPMEGLND